MQTITVSLYGDNVDGQNFIASVKAYDILIKKRWHGYDEISIKAYADAQVILDNIGGSSISNNAIRWVALQMPMNTTEFYKVSGMTVESFGSSDSQNVTITGTDPRSWLYETMGADTSSNPTITGTPRTVIKKILGRCSKDSKQFGVPSGWDVPIRNATDDTISKALPTAPITIRNYDPDCPGKTADEFFSLFPDFSAVLKPIDGEWQWYVIKRPSGVNGKKIFSQESGTAVIKSVSRNYAPSDAIAIARDRLGTYDSSPIFSAPRGVWRMVKSFDVDTNGLSPDDATALCASYAKQLSRNTPYGHVQAMLDYTRFISSANVGEMAALRIGAAAYDIPVNEIAYGFNQDSGWLSKAFVDSDLMIQAGDAEHHDNYKGIIVRLGSADNSQWFWENVNIGLNLFEYDPVHYYATTEDGNRIIYSGAAYGDYTTVYEEKANWLIAQGLATKVKDSTTSGNGALYETSLKYTIFCNGQEIFNGKLRFSRNTEFRDECTKWHRVGIQGEAGGFTERTNKLCIYPSDYEPDDYNGWAVPLCLSIFSSYAVSGEYPSDFYISEIIQCKPSWFITNDMRTSGNLNGYKMVDRFNAGGKIEIGNPFGANMFAYNGRLSMIGESKEYPCTIHQDFMSAFPDGIQNMGDGFMTHAFEGMHLTTGVVNPIPKSATSFGIDFMRNMYQGTSIQSVDGMIESNLSGITMNTLPNGFRHSQFDGADMPSAINETMPDSITSIGNDFRKSQYASSTISKTAVETLPSKLVSIGNSFRARQFWQCQTLSDAGTEAALPSTVTKIGSYYSDEKFSACGVLSTVQIEKVPPRKDIPGMTDFRRHEYRDTPIAPGNVVLRGNLTDEELTGVSTSGTEFEWSGLRAWCFENTAANPEHPIKYDDGSNVIPKVNAHGAVYGDMRDVRAVIVSPPTKTSYSNGDNLNMDGAIVNIEHQENFGHTEYRGNAIFTVCGVAAYVGTEKTTLYSDSTISWPSGTTVSVRLVFQDKEQEWFTFTVS